MTANTAQMLDLFRQKDTAELETIWTENDRGAWAEEAFGAVAQILRERGRPLGRQNPPREIDIRLETKPPRFSLGALQRGEMPLGETFWGYHVAARVLILAVIVFVLVMALIAAHKAGEAAIGEKLLPLFAVMSFSIPSFITGIGTWRSAARYKDNRFLARRAMSIVAIEACFWIVGPVLWVSISLFA